MSDKLIPESQKVDRKKNEFASEDDSYEYTITGIFRLSSFYGKDHYPTFDTGLFA